MAEYTVAENLEILRLRAKAKRRLEQERATELEAPPRTMEQYRRQTQPGQAP
jgi:hypothetical protein